MSATARSCAAAATSTAQIESRLQASREALAVDVAALAARLSPREQACQAGRRARNRFQAALDPLLQQAEAGLRGAASTVRQAQEGDVAARRLLGTVAGSASVLLAALAAGSRFARD